MISSISLLRSALLNANGGIAVDTNKFTVADSTGNTVIAKPSGQTTVVANFAVKLMRSII